MVEKICKNCREWADDDSGTCGYEGTIRAENPDNGFHIECEAADDYGLWWRLVTGPEFGCIHWAPKIRREEDDNG